MMWNEFEKIAGYEVSYETYRNVIEPMYLALPENISKQVFVKMLNRKAFEKKVVREPNIKKMLVRDHSGYRTTPNGCFFHIQYVDLVDVDIRAGKFVIAPLDEKALSEIGKSHDLHLGYSYDFDYTQCVDSHKKPIALEWM